MINASALKTTLITSILLFFSQHAVAAESCKDNFEVFDNTQVQTLQSGDYCFVSVHPRNVDKLVYRDFMFDSTGLFMIFDSYGEGSDTEATAARNLVFFPRTKALGYKYDGALKTLSVSMPNGKVVSFNTVKAILTGISGTPATITYDVDPAQRGGLEIASNDGIYMDGGFTRGQSPNQNAKGPVLFKDATGGRCQLYNADVYRYTSDQDAVFKFNDEQLKSVLISRCPQLKF